MVRTLRVRIRFRRPSLPHCGQGAFLGPQGIGITTTVGASVPMLASLVRGGLSTTTFHQGACPNVQAQNGFEPPTIRWRSSRSLSEGVEQGLPDGPDELSFGHHASPASGPVGSVTTWQVPTRRRCFSIRYARSVVVEFFVETTV